MTTMIADFFTRCRPLVISVLFCTFILALNTPVKAEVAILEVVWTNGVNKKSNPQTRYKHTAPQGPLYLWMKIKGNEKIKHKWYRYFGTRPYLEKIRTPERTQKGSRWAVWSGKPETQAGWWRVDVVYANGKPVKCGRRSCRYKIRVVE
jgi:hypothetical protein